MKSLSWAVIKVADKTVDQAIGAIRERAGVFLKDATMIVKLVSFKFSVLGEVARPGTYSNFNNQLTVLEAISMAGDITDFGNRRQVLVLRPTKEGTETFRPASRAGTSSDVPSSATETSPALPVGSVVFRGSGTTSRTPRSPPRHPDRRCSAAHQV